MIKMTTRTGEEEEKRTMSIEEEEEKKNEDVKPEPKLRITKTSIHIHDITKIERRQVCFHLGSKEEFWVEEITFVDQDGAVMLINAFLAQQGPLVIEEKGEVRHE